jgi:hypothetical protein
MNNSNTNNNISTVSQDNIDNIFFHPNQVKYLEKNFPQVFLGPTESEAKLRHYMGQQSVMTFIRSKMRR